MRLSERYWASILDVRREQEQEQFTALISNIGSWFALGPASRRVLRTAKLKRLPALLQHGRDDVLEQFVGELAIRTAGFADARVVCRPALTPERTAIPA
jgi:hypothetical protein